MQAAGGRLLGLGVLLDEPVRQGVDHGADLVVAADRLVRGLVELEVLRVQDDVDVPGVGEFAQFQRRELDLGRPAAAEHVDVRDRGILERLVDVVRDFRHQQLVGVLDQHPGHVEGHVAVADHRDLLGLQRPVARNVGVTVVPGDEVGPAEGPLEPDAGNVQFRVLDGAGGEDHGVVEGAEIVQGQVAAVGDVAEEADVAAVQDFVQRVDDPLDPRVVRGDAVADQAVRGRVRLEEVDADLEVAVLDFVGLGQDVRGVDAGRSGADNRNAERTFGRSFRRSFGRVGHREPF